jgi:hypothetical protein
MYSRKENKNHVGSGENKLISPWKKREKMRLIGVSPPRYDDRVGVRTKVNKANN